MQQHRGATSMCPPRQKSTHRQWLGAGLLLGLLLLAALPAATWASDPDNRYEMGVFPYLPIHRLDQLFGPLAASLDRALAHPVRYRSRTDFASFMQQLREARYDIAYIQPFDYIRIAEQAGYQPVAMRGYPLRAVIFGRADAPFVALEQLAGHSIGLPPEVAAVSYLAKDHLQQHGVQANLRHFPNHDTCLRQLRLGRIDACVVSDAVFHGMRKRLPEQLKVLATSDAIPPTLFVVHQRIGDRQRRQIQRALLQLPADSPLLRKLGKPFVAANGASYEPVRQMWQRLQQKQ